MKRTSLSEPTTKKDLILLKLNLEEKIANLATKEDLALSHGKIVTRLDGIVKELEIAREDRILAVGQTRELREQVDDHEKRISHLEPSAA